MLLKRLALLILPGLLLTLCGCKASETEQLETIPPPAAINDFNFTVLKAGKADAIIMQTENRCVIIDCGEKDDGDEVVEYLSARGIENVDALILTHFDKDHIGGVPEVLEHIEVAQIITADYEGRGEEYEAYLKALDEKGITPLLLTENESFVLDDVLFEIFPPQRKSYAKGDNDFSLAVSVKHGENSFLFTGDALAVRLSEIMSQIHQNYDFLKFPHHGKYNNTTKKFIESVKPAYTVITDSGKNPAEDRTIDVLTAAGSEVYCTKDGDVSVSSDGVKITVSQ